MGLSLTGRNIIGPTTFMPVDFTLEAHEDGAQTVWVGETEPMHGLQVMTGFTLRPDRAALEIASRVYNGNATPRHFLWWANPAVKGGEGHQSVFPPDVTAVFDHGQTGRLRFPHRHRHLLQSGLLRRSGHFSL
ncbi:TPR repeat-containing protein [Escherichia coli]|uniref:TPR repeat-containing protein n=1 Tax=Escherichia coli TaxID=562 RepID=A0A376U4K1_ECOLX|nr:TPR repeat-containing protein [Escherichia coli]